LPWGWEGRRGLAASLGSSGAAGGKARDDMYTKYTLWTLVNVYITNWKITILRKSTISMAMMIFNSYVKLPEGMIHEE